MKHYVYGLYDELDECFIYIGKGSQGRVYYHRKAVERNYVSLSRNTELYSRVKELIEVDKLREIILVDDLDEDTAYKLEEEYTRKYKLRSEGGTLYNRCYGNWIMTDKARSNMQKKRSATISELYKGEGNPFYGKKHSEESKRKISENNSGFSGHSHSESYKEYMSNLLKGRQFSEETISKMRGPNKKTKEIWVYDTNSSTLHYFHSYNGAVRELKLIYPEFKWSPERLKKSMYDKTIRYNRFIVTNNEEYALSLGVTFND